MSYNARLLSRKQEGDAVSAADWNALLDAVARPISGPGVISGPLGTVILPGGGSGGGIGTKAKIGTKAGTEAPFKYSAVEVEHDGSSDHQPANYTTVSGGQTWAWEILNDAELGPSGAGAAPLQEGDIVEVYQSGELWYCSRATRLAVYA